MESTTQQTVDGFAIKLIPFTGLGCRTKRIAGLRRSRIIGLEVYRNGYTLVVLMRWPWSKPLYARGRYDDKALQGLPGITDTQLKLVQAAREGEDSLRMLLAAHFHVNPDHPDISRVYMPIQTALVAQSG